MKTKTTAFKGTAQDIGCDFFLNLVMPVIREASNRMPAGELAQLYAGFFAGACGSMAADFGKDAAKVMIDAVAAQFDDVVQHVDAGMMQ